MNRTLYLIVLLLPLISCTAPATEDAPPTSYETSLDAGITGVIDSLYASITYDGQEEPDWELMRAQFLDEAYMIPVTDSSYTRMSVDDFIDLYEGQISSGLIKEAVEYEIHNTGDQFGNIAQVFSTYRTEVVTADDTLRKRGINSIQLLKGEMGWKINSIIWYDENDRTPIPPAYLGK